MGIGPDGDERLIDLASSVDDGKVVDWNVAERMAADDAERLVIAELRVVAGLAHLSRTGTELTTTAQPEGGKDAAPPGAWGPLRLIGPIGSGTFGTVYKAKDNLNREVALKLFNAQRQSSLDVSNLLREGRLLARVRHPNVVIVHGIDVFDSRAGVWMELIRGRTLEHELRTRGVFGAEEAALIGLDLSRALAAVHEAGLVHRDVKAQNVMREVGGRIVLMDFGASADNVRTPGGWAEFAGTPSYVAPEVFAHLPPSKASDIYSLGVLLFHLVTDRYPIPGSDRQAIQRSHEEGRRIRLRDLRADLPERFVQVVESALSADPDQRYQTAGEFEHALSNSRTPQPLPAPIPAPRPPVPRWLLASVAGAAAVLLMAFVLMRPPQPITDAPKQGGQTVASTLPAATATVDATPYTVEATFYRSAGRDQQRPLAFGDRVAPGDTLAMKVRASDAVYVYVVNEDDRGEVYVLYPLPGPQGADPLAANTTHELPGMQGGEAMEWQITSAGGQEHFVVYASPTRVAILEGFLNALPRPARGRPVLRPQIPNSMLSHLRGVGGLVPTDSQSHTIKAHFLFEAASPLHTGPESVTGIWVRQLTLDNPAHQ